MRPSPPGPLSHRPPVLRERGKNAAAGYNLVMLMVLLTVLNIMIAASLPSWSSVIRREKEEELIFRGLQYAEAIRLFKNRFERDPVRLEELIEVQPRFIRKLWKDPMTEDGKWALISALAPQQQVVRPPGVPPPVEEPLPGGEEPPPQDEEGDDNPTFGPKKGETQVGPFKGVHSKSRKTSFLLFNGKDRYDEWHFTSDLFQGGAPIMGALNPAGQGEMTVAGQMPQRARWIGRPLPAFLQIPQGSGLPQDPDQNPGSGSGGDLNGRGNGGTRKPS